MFGSTDDLEMKRLDCTISGNTRSLERGSQRIGLCESSPRGTSMKSTSGGQFQEPFSKAPDQIKQPFGNGNKKYGQWGGCRGDEWSVKMTRSFASPCPWVL